jgi:hypothetical protein
MSLPILPDVLAFHVCPFLGNRERASMLQLCHGVRRDLVARKVSALVRYHIFQQRGNNADIERQFDYMRRHGTQRLSLMVGHTNIVRQIKQLDKLRELRVLSSITSIGKYTAEECIISKYMPASLEKFYIHTNLLNCNLSFNLDLTPNLQHLEIRADTSTVNLVACNVPQCLTRLSLHVFVLSMPRDYAARIMAAPKFAHFNLITRHTRNVNEIFDGLDAPSLETFSSQGEHGRHNYDLRAPKLWSVTCDKNFHTMCMPKSAPNITHITSGCINPTLLQQTCPLQFLTTLTLTCIKYTHITALPLNLKILNLIGYWSPIEIEFLPPYLEKLRIKRGWPVYLNCELPKTLKEIRCIGGIELHGGCVLHSVPRDCYRIGCKIVVE